MTVFNWTDGDPLPARQSTTIDGAVGMLSEHRHTLVRRANEARKENPASEDTRRANESLALFDAKTAVWWGVINDRLC